MNFFTIGIFLISEKMLDWKYKRLIVIAVTSASLKIYFRTKLWSTKAYSYHSAYHNEFRTRLRLMLQNYHTIIKFNVVILVKNNQTFLLLFHIIDYTVGIFVYCMCFTLPWEYKTFSKWICSSNSFFINSKPLLLKLKFL